MQTLAGIHPTDQMKRPSSVVLIVEHQNRFYEVLERILVSRGLQVERAASAGEARQRLQHVSPDLILANCELPDESGWLMVGKWCLTRMSRRVWLYQGWPGAFDQEWADFTKVERILYHKDEVHALANRVRSQLAAERGCL